MDVLAHAPGLRHRCDHRWREIIGMRAREAETLYSWQVADRTKQARKIILSVEVGVHGLAQ
jgi:hypothetical protein